jgi:hypothetical protein
VDRFCFACASGLGYGPVATGSLLGTTYQVKKFSKHTMPTGYTKGLQSVFDSPDAKKYESYIVSAVASGYIEIGDPRGPDLSP